MLIQKNGALFQTRVILRLKLLAPLAFKILKGKVANDINSKKISVGGFALSSDVYFFRYLDYMFSTGNHSEKIKFTCKRKSPGNSLIIHRQLTKFEAPSYNNFLDILITIFQFDPLRGHNATKGDNVGNEILVRYFVKKSYTRRSLNQYAPYLSKLGA